MPAAGGAHHPIRTPRDLLREGRFETVSEVAAEVGLSRAYFGRAYRAWAGISPGEEPRR